jgi:hypothetical protein
MRANLQCCFLLIIASLFFSGCKKQTDTIEDTAYQTERLSEIMPLGVGKYILYQTDSLVFTNFQRTEEIHSYIEKDTVDAAFTDAMGRTSYRVTRFLKDIAGTNWFSGGTYFVTPTAKTTEVIEDNLRFVKLVLPLKQDVTWKGNLYLPTDPYDGRFNFGNKDTDWDYKFSQTNGTFSYNGTQLDDVVTVTAIDTSFIIDTVAVTNTTVNLTGKSTVYLSGNVNGPITITADAPKSFPMTLTVYNRTNVTATLDDISIPANMMRTYEYVNGEWTFGSRDASGARIDYLDPVLPNAFQYRLVEKYAKGIGVVYQEYTLWEYSAGITPDKSFLVGFGVKRRMINHN